MRAKQSKKTCETKEKPPQTLKDPARHKQAPKKSQLYLHLRRLTPGWWDARGKSDVLDILSCIRAHIRRSLLHASARDQFPGVILEPNDLTIIALNSLLPARMRPRKGFSALCTAPDIVLHIRVRIWLGVELSDVKLARVEIAPIVPNKRSIGTNRSATARRGNSCSVEEASNSESGALGETKPGINLIVIDQFDLVGGIGSDIHALNITKNTNELPGVLAILYVPTGSFTELLQSVVPEDRQPTLVWSCIAMHNPWELASQPRNGIRRLNEYYSYRFLLVGDRLGTSNGPFSSRSRCIVGALSILLLLIIGIKSGIPTRFGCLLQHVNDKGIQGDVKRLIWAVRRRVEFGLEALEGTVSDGLRPNLIPQNVASLPARDDIPLLTLLENESANGAVSPPSHGVSSTIQVELGTELGSSGTRHPDNQLDLF